MSGDDENHLIAERRAKLAKLRERGNAFPNDFRRDALAADILTAYGEKSAEALEAAAVRVIVAGRMRAKRFMTIAKAGMSAMWSAPKERCSAPRPASCRYGRCGWRC